LAASALVGLAAFYLRPPLKEQYGGAADNVNFSFHIIVRSDNDSGWQSNGGKNSTPAGTGYGRKLWRAIIAGD